MCWADLWCELWFRQLGGELSHTNYEGWWREEALFGRRWATQTNQNKLKPQQANLAHLTATENLEGEDVLWCCPSHFLVKIVFFVFCLLSDEIKPISYEFLSSSIKDGVRTKSHSDLINRKNSNLSSIKSQTFSIFSNLIMIIFCFSLFLCDFKCCC